MKDYIQEWTASKNTNEFNYDEALVTLSKDKLLVGQSIEEYLHFDFSNQEIREKFEAIENLKQEYINDILDLINKYSYYLKMNKKLKSRDDKNIKKLKQINKIFDDEFINFLDRYLYLDKTISLSNESLKIVDNYVGVIKDYLQYNFKFSLNQLEKFLNHSQRKDSITLSDKDLTNSLLIKPKTKAYLKPIGERGILKCLYFDLIYHFENVTKEQSIDIIREFFDVTLKDKKIEHTLSAKAIEFIKNNKEYLFEKLNSFYVTEFDEKGKIIKKQIPNYINEIKEILILKNFISDNFTPTHTINDK